MNIDLFEPPIQLTKTDLEFQRKLGEGAYASVWRVKDKASGNLFALKMVQKSKVEKILPQFRREVSIMYEVEHPHIVKLHTHFEDFKSFYLLMDLCEAGTLFHKLYKEKSFTEKVAHHYFRQIVSAIEYLHNKSPPIIHRDIKPENILLTKKNRIKVTDFGWANYLSTARNTTCGTPEYLPPEIIEERSHDCAVDIWCLGVLLYEMLCGTTPFKAAVKEMLVYNITKGAIVFPKTLSGQVQDLIKKMLDRTEKNRITIEEIKNHEWIKKIPEKEEIKPKLQIKIVNVRSVSEDNTPSGLKMSKSGGKSDDKVEDITGITNFSEAGSGTKESIKLDDMIKYENDETEVLQNKYLFLESRIKKLQQEKSKLDGNERSLQQSLYNAKLLLDHLQNVDTISSILENINNEKTEVFSKTQQCKKQNFYLNQLKNKLKEQNKDFEEKEDQLKQLIRTQKSLNLGMSRIKTYKSLDINTLQIELDVMQHQLGEKTNRYSCNSTLSISDLKDLILSRTQELNFWDQKDYEKKMEDCHERSSAIEQSIADITINYQKEKGNILQDFRKRKEALTRLSKSQRDDSLRRKSIKSQIEKRYIESQILETMKTAEKQGIIKQQLDATRLRLEGLREALKKEYLQVKGMRKARNRLREVIDVKEMEIDDLQFEIDKIKSMSKLKIWKN